MSKTLLVTVTAVSPDSFLVFRHNSQSRHENTDYRNLPQIVWRIVIVRSQP